MCTPVRDPFSYGIWHGLRHIHCDSMKYDQAGDTRIPLPRKPLWTQQKIVDCKVGLCTSLRTVAEFL